MDTSAHFLAHLESLASFPRIQATRNLTSMSYIPYVFQILAQILELQGTHDLRMSSLMGTSRGMLAQ